jgi:LAS superfamily LD-carboxypeptidase LdcB
VHGQSPGAACLGQDQGLHHQHMIGRHRILHLLSVQVMRSLGPRLRPGLVRCLQALVLAARKAWFPTEMAPQILQGSREHWNVFTTFWLLIHPTIGTLC